MSQLAAGSIHKFLTGETVTGDDTQVATNINTAFELLRLAGNDTDTKVNNTYTKAQVDANTYTRTQLDAGQLDSRYPTETEVNNALVLKADVATTYTKVALDGGQLDTRYYTESEIDTQLAGIQAGQIVANSITNTQLSPDVKVGSLTALTTTDKSSVSAAINEVNSADNLLTKIKTVDGAGSLLDADLLDGVQLDKIARGIGDLAYDASPPRNSMYRVITSGVGSLYPESFGVGVSLSSYNGGGEYTLHFYKVGSTLYFQNTGDGGPITLAGWTKVWTSGNDGGFLGEYKGLVHADFNTQTTAGIYHGVVSTTLANEPLVGGTNARRVTLEVKKSGLWIEQRFYYENAWNAGRIFWRTYDGNWSPWVEEWTTAMIRTTNGYVEWNDGGTWKGVGGVKSVQRGTVTIANASPWYTDVTITAVNTSKSFTAFHISVVYSGSTTMYRMELLNSTTLRFHNQGTTGAPVVSWEVIESY